jgi:hypothetical protein
LVFLESAVEERSPRPQERGIQDDPVLVDQAEPREARRDARTGEQGDVLARLPLELADLGGDVPADDR